MSRIWIERLAVVLAVAALAGCATSKEKLLTHGDQTMLDIWNQETGGPAGGRAAHFKEYREVVIFTGFQAIQHKGYESCQRAL